MSTAIRRSLPFVLFGILAVGLIAILILSSGSRTNFNYNGKWTGHREFSGPDPGGERYTLGWVTLTIKDDKFEMIDKGIPTGGTVSYSPAKIVLHTETLMMLPLSHGGPNASREHPDIAVTPQPDGSLKFDDPAAIDQKSLFLIREKASGSARTPSS